MNLHVTQFQYLAKEIQLSLQNQRLISVVETASRHYVLEFEKDRLLICLQHPFLRFHLSYQKRKGKPCKFENVLAGKILKDCSILHEDRILLLDFAPYSLIVEFFPKAPNLVIKKGEEVVYHLNPIHERQPFQHPPQDVELLSSRQVESLYLIKEKEFERQQLTKNIHQEIKRTTKQMQGAEEQLKRCHNWQALQHEGELLQANFYRLKKGPLVIEDWDTQEEKTFIIETEPQKEVERRFKQAKKLKNGIQHWQDQLVRLQATIDNLHQSLKALEAADDLTPFKKAPPTPKERLPYKEYISEAGIAIWVGRSAKDNDALTFHYARGNDTWLHTVGYAGSHVVIRSEQPDQATLKQAMELALQNSKAKQAGAAEICITQRKYVTRMGKNKPGKVQVSKQKVVYYSSSLKR